MSLIWECFGAAFSAASMTQALLHIYAVVRHVYSAWDLSCWYYFTATADQLVCFQLFVELGAIVGAVGSGAKLLYRAVMC